MVKRFFSKRTKKTLFFNLFLWGASFVILTLPLFAGVAQAGTFSFLEALFVKAATVTGAKSSSGINSQTMPLLAAAVNLDPNPAVGGGDITVDDSALVPQGGPSGPVAVSERTADSSQISVYTVREDETLSEIAEMFNVSVNTIAWANNIQGRVIHPGQELVILPVTGVRHTVAKGETLLSIAKKYNGDLDEIANYNELATNASLSVGDLVIIPDGVIAPPPAPRSSRSTAVRSAGGPAAAAGYYGLPVNGGILTQGIHGFNGIDIGASYGTNILAAAAGTVIVARAGGYNGGYGSYVVIQHNNGTQTLYAHASAVLVSVGVQVARGQQIARVGSTGKSTGNHLHFEVRGAKNPFAN